MLQIQTQQNSTSCNNYKLQTHKTTRFNRKSTTSSTSNHTQKPSTASIMKKSQNTESVKKWLLKSIVSFKSTDNENKPVQMPPQLIRYHSNDGELNYNKSPRDIIHTEDNVNMGEEAIDSSRQFDNMKNDDVMTNEATTYSFCRHAIRSTNMDKSIEAKKKVIRMLFVIIVEFFVCWAPIHIMNTVSLLLYNVHIV